MKWVFAELPGESYYFGEMSLQYGHGLGLYIYKMQNYFYGQWENGELREVFDQTEESELPNEDYRVINPKKLFDKFDVFNQMTEFTWESTKNDLLHKINESCKYIYNGSSSEENNEFKIKKYELSNLSKIHQVLKHIHVFFLLNKYPTMLLNHFMLVNYDSKNLEFYLFTNYYENPFAFLKNIGRNEKNIVYSRLLESLNKMHENKISPDNISPKTIVATKNTKMENILAINDFTKAKIFDSIGQNFVNSILTRKRDFRAPEIYLYDAYDPFKSDIFSVILTIYAFEMDDSSIGQSAEKIEHFIRNVKEIEGFIPLHLIKKCLDAIPNNRPSLKDLLPKNLTTEQ